MKKIIDLSREITDNIPVYPGDDETKLYQTRFIEKDGYNNHKLETGMHVGTHMDAPMHMTQIKTYVSDIPLEKLIGKGILINAENTEVIEYREEYEKIIEEESIVLIHTGYSKFFGTEEYFTLHPVISEKFGQMLVRKKVKAICMDSPSPDKYPFKLHKLLLENEILIAENLTNLEELKNLQEYEIFIVPLNIRADGSLARVFAKAY